METAVHENIYLIIVTRRQNKTDMVGEDNIREYIKSLNIEFKSYGNMSTYALA